MNHLIYGANDIEVDVAGFTIRQIADAHAETLNLDPNAVTYVDGVKVESKFVVQAGQRIEWMREHGEKGIGEVCTKELFCRSFHITEAEWDECLEAELVTASLKHTLVFYVEDGVKCLERVRRKRQGSPRLDRLNATERAIVDVLKNGNPRTGEEIAAAALCKCNSHFRATLSALVKTGVIQNDNTGYFMS